MLKTVEKHGWCLQEAATTYRLYLSASAYDREAVIPSNKMPVVWSQLDARMKQTIPNMSLPTPGRALHALVAPGPPCSEFGSAAILECIPLDLKGYLDKRTDTGDVDAQTAL